MCGFLMQMRDYGQSKVADRTLLKGHSADFTHGGQFICLFVY